MKLTEKLADALHFIPARKKYLKGGAEVLSSVPHAPHVNRQKPPTMDDRISQALRSEQFRRAAENAGAETEEEANDFNVGDDYDPQSEHEIEIQGVPVKEILEAFVAANPVKGAEGAAEPVKPLDGHDAKTQSKQAAQAEPPAALEAPSEAELSKFKAWLSGLK